MSPDELSTKTKADQGYTFLHALAGFTRDRQVLRDQLVAVLLAGRDTTASSLSWLFYELARHPEVVKKLRKEIIDQVGLERAPTYNDLKNMRYLQVCSPNDHLRLSHTKNPTELHERSSPPLPRRPLQRPSRPERHHSPPRRRSRRSLPHRHPQRHPHWLLHSRNAASSRPDS